MKLPAASSGELTPKEIRNWILGFKINKLNSIDLDLKIRCNFDNDK